MYEQTYKEIIVVRVTDGMHIKFRFSVLGII